MLYFYGWLCLWFFVGWSVRILMPMMMGIFFLCNLFCLFWFLGLWFWDLFVRWLLWRFLIRVIIILLLLPGKLRIHNFNFSFYSLEFYIKKRVHADYSESISNNLAGSLYFYSSFLLSYSSRFNFISACFCLSSFSFLFYYFLFLLSSLYLSYYSCCLFSSYSFLYSSELSKVNLWVLRAGIMFYISCIFTSSSLSILLLYFIILELWNNLKNLYLLMW